MGEDTDNSSRQRILAATAEVLGRNGMTKLSLSEVALQAGVSRPTLYRYFADKRELLDAFVVWERQYYERAVADATAEPSAVRETRCGVAGHRRIPAVLSRTADDRHRAGPGHQETVASHSADAGPARAARLRARSRAWRCRPRSAWRFRITWCAATMTTTSLTSYGTPRASSISRLEFGEDLVGVLA